MKLQTKLQDELKVVPGSKIDKIKEYVKNNQRFLAGALVVLLILGFGGWQYQQNQVLKKKVGQLQGTDAEASAEVKALVSKVGKLIVLPEEEPTVATVTDPSKLAGQAFFATAKTGDKVLIYANAKKAVLYRPEEGKIVEVAPINLGEGESGQVAGSSTQVTDKSAVVINIQNASKISGLAQRVAAKLKVQGYQLVSVSDAPAGAGNTTTMRYGDLYRDIAPEVNKLINDQAKTEIIVGAPDITLVLGADFVE
jgi:hypothetical protein